MHINGAIVHQRRVVRQATRIVEARMSDGKEQLSTHLLLQAIEQSRECMVLADLAGTIIYANSAKAELMGQSKEELVGTNFRPPDIPLL